MKTLILHMPSQEDQETIARITQLPLEDVSFAVRIAAQELAKGFGAGFANPDPRTVVAQYATFILMRLQAHLFLTSRGVPEDKARAVVLTAFRRAVATKPASPTELSVRFGGEIQAMLCPATHSN